MSQLDIEALSLFVRAAELESFSRVAVALGVTQPSVSRPIADLEGRLGGPLFYRTGRGVALTELGKILLPRAKALIENAEQLLTDALAHGKAPSGNVTIAALPSMMAVLAPALYTRVRSHAPGIRLRILEGFSDQVERWLADGTVDIGLLSRYRAPRSGQDESLFRAPLVLIRSATAPPMPSTVPFEALVGLPLVLPSHPNGLRVLLEETARKHKASLKVVIEADSLPAQRELVRQCGCYSVVATPALDGFGPELAGSRLTQPDLLRYAMITTTQQRPLSRASRVVLQSIRNFWPDDGIQSLSELARTLEGAKHSKMQREDDLERV
jgi:LysR family transcriptional regulator, nitrogen assimilation regulatory protein